MSSLTIDRKKNAALLLLSALIISTLLIGQIFAQTYVLQIYYDTNDDTEIAAYAAVWLTQSFTTSGAFTITKVSVEMFRVGVISWNVNVSIKAVDANHKPTGNCLASGSANPSGWSTSAEWHEFTLVAGHALSASTEYAIVANMAGGGDSTHCIKWRMDTSYPTTYYSGGIYCRSTDSGGTWTTSNYDLMFRTYSTLLTAGVSQTATVTLTGAQVLQAKRSVTLSWTNTLTSTRALEASRTVTQDMTVSNDADCHITQKFVDASQDMTFTLVPTTVLTAYRTVALSMTMTMTADRVRTAYEGASLGATFTMTAGRLRVSVEGATQGMTMTLGATTVLTAHRTVTEDLTLTGSAGRSAIAFTRGATLSVTVSTSAAGVKVAARGASLSLTVTAGAGEHFTGGRTADMDVTVTHDATRAPIDFTRSATVSVTASVTAARKDMAKRHVTATVHPTAHASDYKIEAGKLNMISSYNMTWVFFNGSEPYHDIKMITPDERTGHFNQSFYFNFTGRPRPVWINVELIFTSAMVSNLYTGSLSPFANITVLSTLTENPALFNTKLISLQVIQVIPTIPSGFRTVTKFYYGPDMEHLTLMGEYDETLTPSALINSSGNYRVYQFKYAIDSSEYFYSVVSQNYLFDTLIDALVTTAPPADPDLAGYLYVYGYTAVDTHFFIYTSGYDVRANMTAWQSTNTATDLIGATAALVRQSLAIGYSILAAVVGVMPILWALAVPALPYLGIFLVMGFVTLLGTGNLGLMFDFFAKIITLFTDLAHMTAGAIGVIIQIANTAKDIIAQIVHTIATILGIGVAAA